ncbi:MAG: insulinase family protein [Fimbriimonadaceae bacterium]|nr:insulinase family protein [Chthonomonadaceae bacterium]MCO5295350.1 insulinase family protein [Fimbriimonadaceae bacterium]
MSILIEQFTLANGLRILVEPIDTVRSAAIGLWCHTGSRHELASEAGITHLIEHMLFKGTPSRSAKEIAEAIEGRGGVLNAFTDKEATCYYCRTLADDVENGIEVLADMMRNSLIDPEELAREQGVVLEEIKRSEDEPSDHVHDLHLESRWPGHPLGLPVIGTRESVSGFSRDNLTAYLERRYRGGNVILSVVGHVDPKAIAQAAERTLGSIPAGGDQEPLDAPHGSRAENWIAKDVEQVHFCIGTDGVGVTSPDLYTQSVLDSALGGSMSSRLFQEIREKRGLVYAIGSYALAYSSGGAYTVYGGTSPSTWDQVQELVRQEFDRVMRDGLEDDELERTKRHLSGNLVLALEGMSSRMMRISRNELNHGRQIPIDETLSKIEAVTNTEVVEQARQMLTEELVSTTAIGPG